MSTGLARTVGVEYFGTVSVAMVTPFDQNGALDLEAGRRLARHLVDHGCDSLVLAGTTGEAPTTTVEEKLDLLDAVKAEVGSDARIIAGVGTNNTRATVELASASVDRGADGLLVVTPYYSKPSQAGVIAHMRAVADATPAPICLYDIPGRSGIPLQPDTIRQLATIPSIKAVKDAKGDLGMAAELIADTSLAWYSGDDPLNLPWLTVGASGFISVVGHAAPHALREQFEHFNSGDLDSARTVTTSVLAPLIHAQGRLGGATMAKAALRLQGIDVGDPRLPVAAATETEVEALRDDLEKAGVL